LTNTLDEPNGFPRVEEGRLQDFREGEWGWEICFDNELSMKRIFVMVGID
jgi:hypothetical protein